MRSAFFTANDIIIVAPQPFLPFAIHKPRHHGASGDPVCEAANLSRTSIMPLRDALSHSLECIAIEVV